MGPIWTHNPIIFSGEITRGYCQISLLSIVAGPFTVPGMQCHARNSQRKNPRMKECIFICSEKLNGSMTSVQMSLFKPQLELFFFYLIFVDYVVLAYQGPSTVVVSVVFLMRCCAVSFHLQMMATVKGGCTTIYKVGRNFNIFLSRHTRLKKRQTMTYQYVNL